MSKTLEIRNVPDAVHAAIRKRAARAGLSMSAYLLGLISELVSVPTEAEAVRRADELARTGGTRAMPTSKASSGQGGTDQERRAMMIMRVGPGNDSLVRRASYLLDDGTRPEATRRFLDDPNHHLLIAYEDDVPAGFVSGVEVTHPDKGTEMFLYELGVDERFRRRGIGRALTEALAELARERGCVGMFVLTEHDNEAALATYQAAGGVRDKPSYVMFDWKFDDE